MLDGRPGDYPIICAAGLFSMTGHVRIHNNIERLPLTTYISNHHRRDRFEDTLIQFLFAHNYSEHVVLVNTPSMTPIREFFARHIFGANNLHKFDSAEEKYWQVAQIKPHSMVSIFPDRDGSHYEEDRSMKFRSGVFAASIFNQVPIIDIVISWPTYTDYALDIDIEQWEPPRVPKSQCKNKHDYKIWREANKVTIHKFMIQCEKNFFNRLQKYDYKFSCSVKDSEGLCKPNSQIADSLKRNNDIVQRQLKSNYI